MARIQTFLALLLPLAVVACADNKAVTPTAFALCANCHTVKPGERDLVGPNLAGLFEREAGAKPGFNYSDGLAHAHFVWDDAKLDRWLENPQAFIADARMYVRVQSSGERAAAIAYLHRAATAK